MKNKEKFMDKILEITVSHNCELAVDIKINKPSPCGYISCGECLFGKNCCVEDKMKWLNEEYNKWENVETDTKILVKNRSKDHWERRHFHEYKNGKVYAYARGRTSFTTSDCSIVSYPWEYAKLYDEESED